MKREELARKLAQQAHLPAAQARDEVDALVHKILKSLREGRPVKFPGIGKLVSPPVIALPVISLPGKGIKR
jgi:nucleoid DNA-binding protein